MPMPALWNLEAVSVPFPWVNLGIIFVLDFCGSSGQLNEKWRIWPYSPFATSVHNACSSEYYEKWGCSLAQALFHSAQSLTVVAFKSAEQHSPQWQTVFTLYNAITLMSLPCPEEWTGVTFMLWVTSKGAWGSHHMVWDVLYVCVGGTPQILGFNHLPLAHVQCDAKILSCLCLGAHSQCEKGHWGYILFQRAMWHIYSLAAASRAASWCIGGAWGFYIYVKMVIPLSANWASTVFTCVLLCNSQCNIHNFQ